MRPTLRLHSIPQMAIMMPTELAQKVDPVGLQIVLVPLQTPTQRAGSVALGFKCATACSTVALLLTLKKYIFIVASLHPRSCHQDSPIVDTRTFSGGTGMCCRS